MKKWVFGFAVLFSLASCKEDDSKNPCYWANGKAWHGKSTAKTQVEMRVSSNLSSKQAQATTTAAYGEQAEKGTFRLTGDKLYTTAETKIEKLVKLATLTADSLVIDMNRAGESEQLILVKK